MKKFDARIRTARRLTWLAAAACVTLGSIASVRADEPPRRERRESREERSASDDLFGMERLFVPRWRLTDGPHVRSAFRDVVKNASAATVSIQCDSKQLALGGIISADGWIVTKATPLCGDLMVLLTDGRKFAATVVAKSGEHDLALLKIEGKNLPSLDIDDPLSSPMVGSWLASVGRSKDPVAVGVVSVPPRKIPSQAGILGVQIDENDALIVQVFPDGAAEQAGVKADDLIISVNGIKTPSRVKLRETVSSFNPGDEVELLVEREGKEMKLRAILSGDFPGLPMGRSEFQNNLGGKLSVRRFGFPLAFQHDTVLRPNDCGGPVVDLDGRVVGFNIARAGRTESYALPVDAVHEVLSALMKDHLLVKKSSETAESAEELEEDLDLPAAKSSVAPATPKG